MRQRDLLDKIALEKGRRKYGGGFPVGLYIAILTALGGAWYLSSLTQGQVTFFAAAIGGVLFVYASIVGANTSKNRVDNVQAYGETTDIHSRSAVPEQSPANKRSSASTMKVAQRMKELTPQGNSTYNTKFIGGGGQVGVRSGHFSGGGKDAKVGSGGGGLREGNAWSNARSLVDFTAATVNLDRKDEYSPGYDQDSTDPAASSVLFWHRDENYDSPAVGKGNVIRSSGDSTWSGGMTGSSAGATPCKTLSFSTTPLQNSGGSMRRAGRYYASPPESSMMINGELYSPGGKKRGGQTIKPSVKDCMKVLGLELVDDEYVINLKRILGDYLSDSVRRFDVLVAMITQQLKTGNKITDVQVGVVKGVLGHTSEKEPTSSLLSNESNIGMSLSDVLSFCRRPDVKECLVVCDKSSGMVSELTTEYEALLCLFKIPGDHSGTTHRPRTQSATSQQSTGNNVAPPNGFISTMANVNTQGKGFYSSLYTRPAVTNATIQPTPQLVGTDCGYEGAHDGTSSTSYIITRAHKLASDSHLGKFIWRSSGPAPIRQRNGMLSFAVEDAEIVMALFLHFYDTNFSPLVASAEHRFSSLRFFDASNGVPLRLPQGKASVCIIRKSYDPIHFNIVTQDSVSDKLTELTIRGGRQNVFETILLFLLFLKKTDSSFSGNPHVRGVMDDLFTGYSDSRGVSDSTFRYPRRL